MKTGRVAFGALAGVVIGAIAGVLFAPEKGSKVRKKIIHKGDHYVDIVKSKYNNLLDSLSDNIKRTKNETTILEENEKAIAVLNSLITINNDRIKGYETASKETEEPDLKALFRQFISTSQKCKQELVKEVITLGGEETEETKTIGKFFRVWMDAKAALTGKNSKAILNACEYGEDKALDTYDKALKNELKQIKTEQQVMINAQKLMLKADHDHLKKLRDTIANK
ncbi:PA2169 family four-helix-bundle protein [Natronoflexus pectinivorans]|uniref:Uncharacterized protein (TIGR02284 family) n=1 Tax=Natronoflexus pectinivorans TaxID=682526 RepID=A0A4R2GP78_9BACT|nr:PA2169 family four-helix-bundle protein [Natronoflexus pectinivorans]TCO11082.1 uncharacterized protein (TIGR02284 family) [Natronoflexus pectinivorans]